MPIKITAAILNLFRAGDLIWSAHDCLPALWVFVSIPFFDVENPGNDSNNRSKDAESSKSKGKDFSQIHISGESQKIIKSSITYAKGINPKKDCLFFLKSQPKRALTLCGGRAHRAAYPPHERFISPNRWFRIVPTVCAIDPPGCCHPGRKPPPPRAAPLPPLACSSPSRHTRRPD
jgi:hypothetical protein